MEYRREIDGLRALAVLPVILFHAGFELFSGGFVGVDVFFVISGYLITTIILSELEQEKFSIVNFYERRARRILPALFFVMLVCIPFAWIWLLPSDMKDFSQSLVAVSLFSSNILFWRESGYFDTAAELKPLLHTWSLAVEEQYYVLFPLFLMLAWKYGKRWLLIFLAVAFVASLAAAQWASIAKPSAAFYLLPTRGWELLIGAFAAFYLSKKNRIDFSRVAAEVSGWLGFALLGYSVFAFSMATPFPGFYALVPTFGTLLIILFASQETTIGKFVGNKAFVGIGLLSYSAYLWHQPIFSFFKHSDIQGSNYIYMLLIAITLILAYFSWAYIEKPFRDKTKFNRGMIFSLSLLMMFFFITFGVFGHNTDGFENRDGMAVFKDLKYDTSSLNYAKCESYLINNNPKLSYCYGSKNKPTAIVFGDSHADDKFYGIENSIKNYDWRLIGNSSCPPLYGVRLKSVDGTECTDKLDKIFSYIDGQKSIELVVLSFAHMYPLDTLIAADHIQRKFDPNDAVIVDVSNPNAEKIEAFYSGLKQTIDFLDERKIKTIILLDVPELSFFPVDCLKGNVNCSFERNAVLKRQEVIRKYVGDLSRRNENLMVFDPLDIYCSDDSCQILKDERPMYRDSHHLSQFGSLVYGEAFAEWYSKHVR